MLYSEYLPSAAFRCLCLLTKAFSAVHPQGPTCRPVAAPVRSGTVPVALQDEHLEAPEAKKLSLPESLRWDFEDQTLLSKGHCDLLGLPYPKG